MTLRIVVMLFVLFGSVSCKEEFRSLVKISVVNNQNVPVNKANIIINKKKIGETSEDGTFTREIIGEYGDAMKFEIIKNSSTHYFSPYSEKIILKPNHQEIII